MKLFASDFDGTFYFKGKENVFINNLKAVKKFQKENKFAIVTGRPVKSVVSHFEDKDVQPDYVAAYNGGLIVDSKGKILYQNPLSIDFKQFIEKMKNKNIYSIYVVSREFIYKKTIQFNLKEMASMKYFFGTAQLKWVENLDEIKDDVFICNIRCQSEEDAIALSKEIEKMNLNCSVYTNKDNIDIVGKDASKKHAVEILGEYVNTQDITVMGDSYNDALMLSHFHSYTVKSANDDIKQLADHIVDNVSDAIESIL